MKAREIERIRSKYPHWSFEAIQRTLDRLSEVMTKSSKPEKRKAAYAEAVRWFSREAVGVAVRKAGGPFWFGVCPDCNEFMTEPPALQNTKGEHVCTGCAAKYVECPDCHGVHHRNTLVTGPGGAKICPACFSSKYYTCSRCSKVHTIASTTVCENGRKLCPDCKTSYAKTCGDCGRVYDRSATRGTFVTACGGDGAWVCGDCIGNWRQCNGCSGESAANGNTIYHRASDVCPEGYPEDGRNVSCRDREGKFRFFSYHGNPYKDIAKSYMNQVVGHAPKVTKFGLEMEVEGSFKAQARALTAAGLDERDLYAESDATVDVEWVTRPMDIETLIPFLRKFTGAMRPVAKAFDSRKTCGCHTNVDRHALSDENWGKVCIAVSKYFKELRKFSGKHRSESNFPIPSEKGKSPMQIFEACKSQNKYCATAFNKPRVVEIRIAGMTLNEASLVTQAKLYSNLVLNAASPTFDPRASFETVFGPLDDEMTEVCRRKEIIATPAGMAVPEDPERPGRKRRVACELPEGRVLRSPHDFVIGDTLEVIHPDEMDDRFGSAGNLGWQSGMDDLVGKTCVVSATIRGSKDPERRRVMVEFKGGKTVVEKAKQYTWTAGMFHLVSAVPPRDPSLRDPYELRTGDTVVVVPDNVPASMKYLGGAVAEVRWVDADATGDRECPVKVKLLTRVKAPEGVDHLRTAWKYTAGMFRLANPDERVAVAAQSAYVPEGRESKYAFKVGDIVKFRTREDVKDDLEEAFFEIDYSTTFDFLVGCRAQVVAVPEVLASPLYQDSEYNRVVKVKVIDKADEYAAKVASRRQHPGEDFRFFTGMFEFARPDAADMPATAPSPYYFRKGDRLMFRTISETPGAQAMDYSVHMAYLQGLTVVMDSPDAVVTPESPVHVHLESPTDRAEHESVLAGLGRTRDWDYRAGMFERLPEEQQ